MRMSVDLDKGMKQSKLKESEKSEWVLVYILIGSKTVKKFTFLQIRKYCILVLVLVLYKFT